MAGGGATWHENQLVPITRGGVREDVYWTYSYGPIDDEQAPHGVGGVLVVCTETTEQVTTSQRLAQSEERLHLALSGGRGLGVWDWDVVNDKVVADSRFSILYGVEPERAKAGAPIAEFLRTVPAEDLPRLRRAIDVALKGGGPFFAEYRLIQADGSVRWVAAQGHCLFGEDGAPTRFPGVSFDITERKATEEELRASQTYLRLILDSAADAFYCVDTEGSTTHCNAAFLRILGFDSEEEVIGRKLHGVIHHSRADGSPYPKADCPIYRTAQAGEPAHVGDEVFFRRDGTSFPVEYWVQPILRDGALQGAICTFHDVSARRAAEEAQNLLLREMNHRVKNLFAVVGGMVALSSRAASDPKQMARAIGGRLQAMARAQELILPTSLSDARRDGHRTDLASLARAVLSAYADDPTEGGGFGLTIDGPHVPITDTAAAALALVFHELATNSVKYGALSVDTGRVAVGWSASGEGLEITWAEQGGPPIAGPPAEEGFGSMLARRSVVGQLAGEIQHDWRPGGLAVKIIARLEEN